MVLLTEVIQGKPAIINAWASWCPFCINELPDLIRLQSEFGEEVRVVGINRNEGEGKADTYLRSINATEGMMYLYDPEDAWYAAIGGYVMPETVFVYADGTVAKHKRGPLTFSEMVHYTELLIRKEPLTPEGATPLPEEIVGCAEEGLCHL